MGNDRFLLFLGLGLCTIGLGVFVCAALGISDDVLSAFIIGLIEWGAGAFCIGLHVGRDGEDL